MSSLNQNKEGHHSTALFYYYRKDQKVNNGTRQSRSSGQSQVNKPESAGQVEWSQLWLPFLQPDEGAKAGDQGNDGDAWGLLRLSFDMADLWHVFEFEIPRELGELLLNYTGDKGRLAVTTSVELLALRLGDSVQGDGVLSGRSILRISRLFKRPD